ncbi:MAG: DMT family transporter [Sphingobacterium thalpophilum]
MAFTSYQAKAKESTGIEFILWITGFLISLSKSMDLLFLVSKTIAFGTSFKVWAGIGAQESVVAGIIFFKDSTDFWRMIFCFF